MRPLVISLFLCLGAASGAQSWEKLITPGLSYRMEIESAIPRVIHTLKWQAAAPFLSARPEVANTRIWSGEKEFARQGMSALEKQAGAIASVNGDFFGASGEPLGVLVRAGELVSRPFPGRAGFAWGPQSSARVMLSWSGSAFIESVGRKDLYGINEDVPDNNFIVFTDAAAFAKCPSPATFVVFKPTTNHWAPTGLVRGAITRVVRNAESVPIEPGSAVLVGRGSAGVALENVKERETVSVTIRTEGADWTKFDNVAGGGPGLLQNGKLSIDWEPARFSKSFSDTRHPRTAIGRNAAGEIFMVVVDGRQVMSAGASLAELAAIMQRYGCTDAINLDGGGSSTLTILGDVLNRPSDGQERRVANGILIFGPEVGPPAPGPFALRGPNRINVGSTVPYQLIGPDGKPVPDRDILWSAMGEGGWVDQGGNARALKNGLLNMRATTQGNTTTLTVRVGTGE